MGKTSALGSFEELVLLAVLRTGENAYGVEIRRELAECTGRDVAMGAVYATLDRLSEKDLLASSIDRRDGVVGRPRRIYRVLPLGMEALRETREVRASMWDGLTIASPGSPES